jgi:hypothetical protein
MRRNKQRNKTKKRMAGPPRHFSPYRIVISLFIELSFHGTKRTTRK